MLKVVLWLLVLPGFAETGHWLVGIAENVGIDSAIGSELSYPPLKSHYLRH